MSDGFKFSDLIKPGEAGRIAMEAELKRRRDQWDRPGYHYRGAGHFLLEHGRYYGPPVEFPSDDWFGGAPGDPASTAGRGGPHGTCFANALHYAEENGLRYCEGLYSLVGSFIAHAWCLTPDDRVLEVTHQDYIGTGVKAFNFMGLNFLPADRWAYWGAVFPTEFVRWHSEQYPDADGDPTYCLLDRGAHEAAERVAYGLAPEGFMDAHDFPVLKVPFDPDRTEL